MRKILITALTACLLTAATARASTNVFDFDSDPTAILTVFRSGDNPTAEALAGVWFPTDGSTLEVGTNPSTNGYFAITQVGGGHRSVIIFDDFDNGLVVAGFKFQADVRIGAGTDNPADGFSLNYARETDPVILNNNGSGFAASPGGEGNLPEEGTQTGLAICFDAWDSGSGDVIGLTIRVDNVIRTNFPLPTLNGLCADPTSMQTGPNGAGLAALCWQPLYAELTTDGKLHVSYKGVALLTNYVVNFAPTPGRLIFGGRVGGSNQHQDVDNIRLVTIPSAAPVVGPTVANANGFKLTISDSGPATPDTNSITLTLDGASVTPSSITQTGNVGGGNGVTAVVYQNTGLLLAAGSTHTNVIHFTGTGFSGAVDVTNVFTVPVYTLLTSADKVPAAVNTSLSGFSGRVHQLPIGRYPDGLNMIGVERQLADGFIDPVTGLPYATITIGGLSAFTEDGVINWSQDVPIFVANDGIFHATQPPPRDWPDAPIPGIDANFPPYNTDNIAAELLTILNLPVGSYELGINHDDGYKLTAGAEPRDAFKAKVLATANNNSDTTGILLVVTNAGNYPVRLIWGEGGGGADLEFYLVDFISGQKILINNRTNPVQITAYRDVAALTQPYVRWTLPGAGETGVNPTATIVVKLEDGTAASVIDGSIQLQLNGTSLVVSNSNSGATTTTTANHSTVASGSANIVTLIYSTTAGGPFTNSWSFNAATYSVLPTDLRTPIGSGDDAQRGFVVEANQVDHGNGSTENNNVATESQLAGLYGPNLADLSGAVSNNIFFVTTWINWNKDSGTANENGNFRAAGGYPEDPLPGITAISGGAGTAFESVAEAAQTYVEFPTAGFYQLAVNSDDNFRVSVRESAPPPVLSISGPTNTALACFDASSDPREENGNRTRFGVPPPVTPLTAPIVYMTPGGMDDPGPYPNVVGKIALLDRGGNNLGTTSTGGKVKAAQDAGAVAVLFTTPTDTGYSGYAGATRTDITVPVLCVSNSTNSTGGLLLKSYLTNAVAVTGTIRGNPSFIIGGADYGKGDSDILMGIFVQQAGVYPMRMAFHQGGGGGNCEFFSVKSDGTKVLLNNTAAGGLKTYRVRTPQLKFNAPTVAGGSVTFTWVGTGTLQKATALTGSPSDWTDVSPQPVGNTYTVPATGNGLFLRLKQ